MSAELVLAATKEVVVTAPKHKFRKQIPASHRTSLDTRIQWLWNQRFGTVQMVWMETRDVLDKTAATLVLQAIMAKDLDSISQLFQRLEGGSQVDTDVASQPIEELRI